MLLIVLPTVLPTVLPAVLSKVLLSTYSIPYLSSFYSKTEHFSGVIDIDRCAGEEDLVLCLSYLGVLAKFTAQTISYQKLARFIKIQWCTYFMEAVPRLQWWIALLTNLVSRCTCTQDSYS